MSDPDARPSAPPEEDPPPPGPVRAVAQPADVGDAARQLAEPLARLETAVTAVRDHLDKDPDRAREELDQARAALEAVRRELAVWSRR
jgi:hypothetical protein